MQAGRASVFLTFACAIVAAEGKKYWQSSTYKATGCSDLKTDTTMNLDVVLTMFMNTSDGKCMASEGVSWKIDASTCKQTVFSSSDCSGTAASTTDMAYASATCTPKDDAESDEKSEKNGCVDSVPSGSTDLTCLTTAEFTAMVVEGACVSTCAEEAKDKAAYDKMVATGGCAAGCSDTYKAGYLKYVEGCKKSPSAASGAFRSASAHMVMIPSALVGLFFL